MKGLVVMVAAIEDVEIGALGQDGKGVYTGLRRTYTTTVDAGQGVGTEPGQVYVFRVFAVCIADISTLVSLDPKRKTFVTVGLRHTRRPGGHMNILCRA